MKNNEIEDNSKNVYKQTSGTGALSAIIFAIVTTIVLTIVAHFVH